MTHNAPEYFVGRGATIDLFILLISACMSCSKTQNSKHNNFKSLEVKQKKKMHQQPK